MLAFIGLLSASMVFGGAKRITDVSGTITDTIVDADSSNGEIPGIPLVNVPHNTSYDRILLYIKANQWDSLGGTGALAHLRLKDSLIVWLVAQFGGKRDTLRIDTIVDFAVETIIEYPVPTWDTTKLVNFRVVGDSASGDAKGVSAGGYALGIRDFGLYYDNIFFVYRNIDSGGGGTNDSSLAVINWRMRLIEND